MRRFNSFTFLLCFIFIFQATSSVNSIWINQEEGPNPFQIYGNEELDNFVITNNLPGSGSDQDPYIIENFEITVPNSENVIGFEIKNTDKFLILRDNSFQSAISGEYWGLSVGNSRNIVIEDNSFDNFKRYGIALYNSQNISIQENQLSNTISNNDFPDTGIFIFESINILLVNNNIISQGIGINIASSNITSMIGNTIHAEHTGIELQNSFYSNVTSNEFTMSGIYIYDNQPEIYMSLELENNKINNKPIEMIKNSSVIPVSIELGQLLLFGVENLLVRDLTFAQPTRAILLVDSKNVEFINLDVKSSSSFGLAIEHSSNVAIYNSTFTNIEENGISIWFSNDTYIEKNDFTNITRSITSWDSSYMIVRENYFSDGWVGIDFSKSRGPAKIYGNTFEDILTPIRIDPSMEVGANYYIEGGKTVKRNGVYVPQSETDGNSLNFMFDIAILIIPIIIYGKKNLEKSSRITQL